MPPAIQHDHKGLTRQEFEELKTKALEARDLSYSPYSKFRLVRFKMTEWCSTTNQLTGSDVVF